MRPFSVVTFALAALVSSPVGAQTPPSQPAPPQTARQALIEMFFSTAPNHLEKHLPDVTRRAFEEVQGADGRNVLNAFSALAMQAKNGKEKLETFDTGSTLATIEGPAAGNFEKIEITVEGDSLSGDEDQIELALHIYRGGKEETLPFIPRFTFSMKMESDVWRLNEVSVAVRIPLADPAFLNSLLERQRSQNEQMTQYAMNSVVSAEKAYQAANGGYACTLSALGSTAKSGAGHRTYLYDSQLISGKKNGYVFAISGCDSSHYQLVAEPAVAGSGQKAFCADESGTVRSSADGKAGTCLSSGEVVEKTPAAGISEAAPPPSAAPSGIAQPGSTESGSAQPGTSQPQRIRISQGVAQGLLVSKVQPIYPPDARTARIQGTVVLRAIISKTGDVESLELVSGHPMLAPAAIEAVKQWKYKPFLLNGNAVIVDTQITVNFTLEAKTLP